MQFHTVAHPIFVVFVLNCSVVNLLVQIKQPMNGIFVRFQTPPVSPDKATHNMLSMDLSAQHTRLPTQPYTLLSVIIISELQLNSNVYDRIF